MHSALHTSAPPLKDSSNILRREKTPLQGNNYSCSLCNQAAEETTYHLFFECPYSKNCWNQIGIQWETNAEFFQIQQQAKGRFPLNNFMEIFITAARNIWKQRNRLIFNNVQPSFHSCGEAFKEEVHFQGHRIKPATRDNILSWLQQTLNPIV